MAYLHLICNNCQRDYGNIKKRVKAGKVASKKHKGLCIRIVADAALTLTMEFFQQPYYKLNMMLMSGLGQWPYQTKRSSRCFLAIVLVIWLIQITPQFMAFSKYHDDPEIIMECIGPLLFDGISAVNLMTCIFGSQKMLKLMNRIRMDWQVWANDREIEILHEYAEKGRRFTSLYTVGMYLTGVIFVTEPFLPKVIDIVFKNGSAPGRFPIPVYYGPIDMEKNYLYIIMYSYVGVSVVIIVTVACDVMFITSAAHGCGIFAAVGHKLRRTGEKQQSADNIYSEKDKEADFDHIASCIERHKEAIEYAQLLEETYTWSFLFIMGFNMLLMSVTGLQIVRGTNEHQDLVRYTSFAVSQMIHLYIETYVAQTLMDHSTNISYYIHSGQWYTLSINAQKLLGLITMRSNVPCKLTAGKMADLNVETFTVIVKASMSYFTILGSMQ